MRDQISLILDSLQNSWYQVAAFTPRLVAALLLLTVGWLLARAAEWLAVRLLSASASRRRRNTPGSMTSSFAAASGSRW